MKEQDYTVSITVDAAAKDVFNSINSVSKWWTENFEGSSQKLNDEFTVRFDEVHVSTQKLIELIPNQKVVWLVISSRLNFIEDKEEWTNTKISFELVQHGNRTQINFTHFGLIPKAECYAACVPAWDQYLKGSLFHLLMKGKGTPDSKV